MSSYKGKRSTGGRGDMAPVWATQGRYITGSDELIKKLSGMERKVQQKILKKANSKAIRPVIQAAKRGARPTSRTIAKSIGMRQSKYQGGQIHTVVAGVRNLASVASVRPQVHFVTGGWSYRRHDPRHTAHLVEKGTKAHTIVIPRFKMIVRHPGTKAKPFLEPAFKSNVSTMTRIHAEILGSEIIRASA